MKLMKWIVGLFKPKSKVTLENKSTENTTQPKEPIKQEVLVDGKFRIGDEVLITCKRKRDVDYFYNGKIGKILHIFNLKEHPWGNYIVILPNMMQNGFFADELRVVKRIRTSTMPIQ